MPAMQDKAKRLDKVRTAAVLMAAALLHFSKRLMREQQNDFIKLLGI
jgi:hypothetical protein